MKAARVLGLALETATESVLPYSLGQSSHSTPLHPQLEQIAEGMFHGRDDKESATIFDPSWSMRKRKENVLHTDSDRVLCETPWALIRHLVPFPHSVSQSTECVSSVSQAQGLTSQNKEKKIHEGAHSVLPASVAWSVQKQNSLLCC